MDNQTYTSSINKRIASNRSRRNRIGNTHDDSLSCKGSTQHNGVFKVKIHGETKGTYIIAPHPQLEEKNPNIFQHEIAITADDEVEPFPLIAVTNLDQAKTLHIGKGEIVCFARPEMKSVTYVATTNKINIEEYVDMSPRNWISRG